MALDFFKISCKNRSYKNEIAKTAKNQKKNIELIVKS